VWTLGTPVVAASYVTDMERMSGIHIWTAGHGRAESIFDDHDNHPIMTDEIETPIRALTFGLDNILCAGTASGSLLIYWW
jgi:hypothetical protein